MRPWRAFDGMNNMFSLAYIIEFSQTLTLREFKAKKEWFFTNHLSKKASFLT
jgi:hypothetical protein